MLNSPERSFAVFTPSFSPVELKSLQFFLLRSVNCWWRLGLVKVQSGRAIRAPRYRIIRMGKR